MARVTIKCDEENGGCGTDFTLDESEIRNEEFLQCMVCSRIIKNPFYSGIGRSPKYTR